MSGQQQSDQILLILCGLPGSGKSTFADALVAVHPAAVGTISSPTSRRWIRACQDETPSRRRQECENIVFGGLRSGHNVIVDRVNFDQRQRSHFINIANNFSPRPKVWCLVFDIPIPVLQRRLERRESHPSIPDAQTGMRVIADMSRQFFFPDPYQPEGIDRTLVIGMDMQPPDGLCKPVLLEGVLSRIERDGHIESVMPLDERGNPRNYEGEHGRGGHGGRGRGSHRGQRGYHRNYRGAFGGGIPK